MLGDVTIGAFDVTSAVRLGAVPGKDVLVRIYGTFEIAPIMPVFMKCVNDIGLVVSPMSEFEEIFLHQSVCHIIFGPDLFLNIGSRTTDEAHEVEWRHFIRSPDTVIISSCCKHGTEIVTVDEVVAECLAVVRLEIPSELHLWIEKAGGDAF